MLTLYFKNSKGVEYSEANTFIITELLKKIFSCIKHVCNVIKIKINIVKLNIN